MLIVIILIMILIMKIKLYAIQKIHHYIIIIHAKSANILF